jgi:hypothetical protein
MLAARVLITELVAAIPPPWLERDLTEEQKHAVRPIEIRSCQSDIQGGGGTLLLFCGWALPEHFLGRVSV